MKDVINAANHMDPALGRNPGATEDPTIYRDGRSEDVDFPVEPDPTHTQYLWHDATGYLGLTGRLPVEAEILGTKTGEHVLGTSDPLPLELDPSPSFPWDVQPYDAATVAQLILALWLQLPDPAPLYARKARGRVVFRIDHKGAFDFRWLKYGPQGIAGRAGLSLLDDEQRHTTVRLVAQMAHGHFIPEEEADVLISDLTDKGDDWTMAEAKNRTIVSPFL